MVGKSGHLRVERTPAAPIDFDGVVEQNQRQLYRLAFDLTGNHHDAEDLAQQTFLEAYQGMNRFRGDASIGTWLRRIAVNTHIDRRRSPSEALSKAQSSLDDADHAVAPVPELYTPATPERTVESASIQEHIEHALRRLSPRERVVFVLRHYHELKLREIATTLEITEGTVKSILFRAIRRLRDELSFYRPELGLKEVP